MHKVKHIILIILGNILEYYDFLLFAHIGYLIVPRFIPVEYTEQSYLFTLVLFSLPFIIRPLGGYVFGRIADKYSTTKALDTTLFYASMASLAIALLPTYQQLGMGATLLFIILRSLQGFALGGEYTTAGTLLMEQFRHHRSLISGILGASGTIGSLIAFGFAAIYLHLGQHTELWRLFFVFGAVATYLSYRLRKHHLPQSTKIAFSPANNAQRITQSAIYKTLIIGAATSVSCFIPMIYTNFYFTKVLELESQQGLKATLIALVTYVICTPAVGYLSDFFNINKHMSRIFMMAMLCTIIGFQMILQGNSIGQIPLTLAASLVGANIHVIMNQLFPLRKRSRNVNLYFTLGASLGGMMPAISGYISMQYDFFYTPLLALSILLMMATYVFIDFKESIFAAYDFNTA